MTGSIVIPAHNEETTIGPLLESLVASPVASRVVPEIIVVANGCSDRTADVARNYPGVQVLELAVGNKASALNAGDKHARLLPRIYLDADVMVSSATIQAILDQLRSVPYARVAAPTMKIVPRRATRLVRCYLRAWEKTDFRQVGHIGSGLYAVNEAGRARFGEFPDLIADDRFVQQLFEQDERIVLSSESFYVVPPQDMPSMIRRNLRTVAGSLELPRGAQRASVRPHISRHFRFVLRSLSSPRGAVDLSVYVLFNLLTRALVAARRILRRKSTSWFQDRSSRTTF